RLKKNSRLVTDSRMCNVLAGLKRDLNVASKVELRSGRADIVPMTWGIVRHTILLPSVIVSWPEDRLRDAIAHELAHVKRRDGIVQLVAQAASAAYWFNPLVWYAAYRIRIERECACDDLVLCLGIAAEDYAAHLLQIAREATAQWVFAGL